MAQDLPDGLLAGARVGICFGHALSLSKRHALKVLSYLNLVLDENRRAFLQSRYALSRLKETVEWPA